MDKKTNTERLSDITGFDPARRPKLTEDLFREVMDDIRQEREEKAQKRARETMLKAIELREQAAKVEKDFRNQMAKFEKELGKLLNQIEQDLQGGGQTPQEEPVPEPAEPTND
jgi:hypothetical protein